MNVTDALFRSLDNTNDRLLYHVIIYDNKCIIVTECINENGLYDY